MNSLETRTAIDSERGAFDSHETRILSAAFEKAWAFVEFDPELGVLEASTRRSELARCLMALLKVGETDPTTLANSAIKTLRKRRENGSSESFTFKVNGHGAGRQPEAAPR